MPQLTIDLDAATLAWLEQVAAANGVSPNCWAAELVRRSATNRWRPEWLALAGSFPDFPAPAVHDMASLPRDLPRLAW